MKRLERFLVILAVLGTGMRIAGQRSEMILALIALPAAALFYLVCSLPLMNPGFSLEKNKRIHLLLPVMAGAGIAYCSCSLLYYLLGAIKYRDVLENTCLILGFLAVTGLAGLRWSADALYKKVLARILLLWAGVLLLGLFKLT